ncbi:hypothetical protein LCGC14_0634430 [marine sediment metagenome]|uniref:Uncharacterized protein n=1 Tax=marine sediment metagenome TaxID=412755 RepID=A0A0F9TML1_9ZZZZ
MADPIKIYWQMATSLNTLVCRMCRKGWESDRNGDWPFARKGFAMTLCEQHNIFPTWTIPAYKAKLRGMIKKHYREFHPEYVIR